MLSSQKCTFSKFGMCVVMSTHNHKIDMWIRKEFIRGSVMLCFRKINSAMFTFLNF